MASFNKTSNNNNNKNRSRFAILETLDNDSEDSPMTATPQDNTFEVTIEVEQAPTRSFSNDFDDLERGLSRLIFDDEDCVFVNEDETPSSSRPFLGGGGGAEVNDKSADHSHLVFDDEDCVFVNREETPSSSRPFLGGGAEVNDEDENEEEEENIAAAPLHVRLNIPGFRADDRSGTLGTISLVLAKLKKSGIHPFPGRTNINLPTIDELVAEGYDHKVTETFKPDLALMNSKAMGTMCKWIYDENPKAMENLRVKINVQSADNAVEDELNYNAVEDELPRNVCEFIFQKKTDKPHATVHGGSTQADVDEVVALVVAKHLAENPNAFGGGGPGKVGGGGGAPKASFKEAALRDPVRESNTPKVSALKEPAPLTESAFKATKSGGSARPTPPRCESWATAETILADLEAATPHEEGLVASATYTLEEGTPEEFATWCMFATGKKSIEISAKKDGKRRVRVFAGDKPGHVKKAPIGGGSAYSKR